MLRHMRYHVDLTEFGHEFLRVKAFIAGQRDLLRSVGMRLYQPPRSRPFSMTRGMRGNSTDNKAMAVFHQRVPHKGQLGFLAAPLAVKHRACPSQVVSLGGSGHATN